jgi:thiopeptide-type bacteriocin biosynthesis protein
MSNKTTYYFHPDLVLRTPRLPLPGELTAQTLPVLLLSDPTFLESIYIASPVVYDECIKWKQGDINPKKIEKLTATLTKYYLRSSTRCTPFGLFSGCSFVEWKNNATQIILDANAVERYVRLDMHYLCILAQKIASAPGVTELLTYYVNNSAYKIGDELRYVEYLFVDGSKKYQITAVQQSEYLTKIISAAKNGKKISELISLIVDEDISEDEAKSFVYDLIDAQVITSELDPKLTGDGLLSQIITTLQRISVQNPDVQPTLAILNEVQHKLENITSGKTDYVSTYREIIALLNEVEPILDESRVFQLDSRMQIDAGGVDTAIQDQLQDVLQVLNKLSIFNKNKNLESFSANFYNKYGDEEMSLLQVLDTETGIGYLNSDAGYLTPLIDNLIIPSKEEVPHLSWGKVEQFLHKKLLAKTNNNCITITDEEIKELEINWKDLPASMSVMFKVIDNTTNLIQLDAIGNATAASLLGRFAHTDVRINKILDDIAAKEQENKPEAIYAEIVHLPENRAGNVLIRPAFREYEIPYLAQSAVAIEKQIDVSDLYISIKGGIIFLRSKRLNKQIIPRLSSAHNFHFNALPVYQFLCDLQTQDMRNTLSFHWGSIDQLYKGLPRVMYNNMILSLAKWTFTDQDIKQLIKSDNIVMEDVQHFRQMHQLPQHVILTDGDNELPVDLENKLSVTVWINTIRKRSSFILKEFIYPINSISDKQQHIYSNQFVATLFKEAAVEKTVRVHKTAEIDPNIKKSFSLGSEWTYYKLYCGLKTADKILAEAIKPLTDELLRLGLIDQYFFIRYNDPEFHIRLRFHLVDINKIGEMIQLIDIYLQPFINDGFIWKQQVDIYTRELERYGGNTIEIAERLFYYDSLALLEMLELTEGDAREEIRWVWTIRAIDELLNCFKFSLKPKGELLTSLKDAFAAEHNVDKPLTIQLNDRFREHKQAIEQIMNKEYEAKSDLFPLIEILYRKTANCSALAEKIIQLNKSNELEVPINEFISSLIHMMVNRIIKAEGRLHEMVIYNFTSRYYQSAIIKMDIDQNV